MPVDSKHLQQQQPTRQQGAVFSFYQNYKNEKAKKDFFHCLFF